VAGEVLHADLELFLTAWYRAAFTGRDEPYLAGIEVDRVERDHRPLLVLRDDSGPNDLILTGTRQVGITALAGTRANPQDALAIARLAVALRTRIPAPGNDNPVAAVTDSNGPYLVAEQADSARAYATVTLRVVGTPLTA